MRRQNYRYATALLAAATLAVATAPVSYADSTGKNDKPKSPPPIRIKIGKITTSHDRPGKTSDIGHKKSS